MTKHHSGGYAGLLVILVATAILAILYVRTYFSPTPTQVVTETGTIETTTTATALDSAHQNIKTAELMQQKLNKQNQEINEALVE